MVSRLEFKISLTAVLLAVAVSFYQMCSQVWGLDQSQLYSAAYGWVGHAAMLDIRIMQIFLIYFIFFVSAMAFSDSGFVDRKTRVQNLIMIRCSRRDYILTGALMSFLGAFFVILVPFLFSQLLSFAIFPIKGFVPTVFHEKPTWDDFPFDSVFPPFLIYRHPYLYNLIAIFYMSFCSGVFATLSYALSFFIRRGRLLVIGIPTVFVLLENSVCTRRILGGSYDFSYYLFMGGVGYQSIIMYFGFPLAILVVSCAILWFKLCRFRDEL